MSPAESSVSEVDVARPFLSCTYVVHEVRDQIVVILGTEQHPARLRLAARECLHAPAIRRLRHLHDRVTAGGLRGWLDAVSLFIPLGRNRVMRLFVENG